MVEKRTGAEHHVLAAEHHEHAALIAYDHTRRAIHHSNEAGKYHVERHDNAKLCEL
jgi:hypothetical protein